MIVWLSVPKSDERYAKRKGAQLSLETGQWFVKDVADLRPFIKWIPVRVLEPTKAEAAKPAEPWIDGRTIKIDKKGRRFVPDSTKGPNLPTFTGKLKGNI